MEEILYQYEMNPTTWVYLSSLLTLAIFFKFNRVFSIRNLDLIGLIALAPGLLLVAEGKGLGAGGAAVVQAGYVWLFAVAGFFLVRLLRDPMMVRRPLLEPNLSNGGMTFIGVSLLVFLTANVITSRPAEGPQDVEAAGVLDVDGSRKLDDLLTRQQAPPGDTSLGEHGPGYPLLHLLPSIPGKLSRLMDGGQAREQSRELAWIATARTMAILSHLAVVIGLVVIGYRHFDNAKTGIAVATLYLLLPYTALMTGQVKHVLPAALLVWAVEAYRRPMIAGGLLGLAIGVIYYPVFLLPLWIGFYWQRGLMRFIGGVLGAVLLLWGSLAFTSSNFQQFLEQSQIMFGWPLFALANADGFWDIAKAPYLYTVLAAFVAMSFSLALWPARKNLGTLLSCSAAVMLATQFWHARGGGLYMAWYLPLLLLTVFRPNLEDRLAITVLDQSWFNKRRAMLKRVVQAA